VFSVWFYRTRAILFAFVYRRQTNDYFSEERSAGITANDSITRVLGWG